MLRLLWVYYTIPIAGGITGAGARITGTVGDVFAKLTFDEDFIDKRQQQKTRPPRLGQKLGGFAKVSLNSLILCKLYIIYLEYI